MSASKFKPGKISSSSNRISTASKGGDESFKMLTGLMDDMIAIEDDNIKTIEDNYETLVKTQDSLLNIDGGTVLGKKTLEDRQGVYGIDSQKLNMGIDELRNPYKMRNVTSSLSRYMGDSKVKGVIKDTKKLEVFQNNIDKLDPQMAKVAKRDVIDIKNSITDDTTGVVKTINDVGIKDYEKVDFDTLFREELKLLPTDIKIEKDKEEGYIIYSETNNFKMTQKEFEDSVVNKYSNDPRVRNTLRSQVDLDKPEEARKINDPDAVEKFLREGSSKTFEDYNGKVVKTHIKKDYLLDQQNRFNNAVKLDNIKTANDAKNIKLKDNLKGTGKKSIAEFKTSDYGKYGAALGKQISSKVVIERGTDLLDYDKIKTAKSQGEPVYRIINEGFDDKGDYVVKYTLNENTTDDDFTELRFPKKETPTAQSALTDSKPNYIGKYNIDVEAISGNEAVKMDGNFSVKSTPDKGIYKNQKDSIGGTGEYSVGDKGRAFGSRQMNGSTWNGFVKYLNENGVQVDNSMLLPKKDGGSWSANRDKASEILNGIENVMNNIGEDKFKELENNYLTEERYGPAIDYLQSKGITNPGPELNTLMSDIANQSGGYKNIVNAASKKVDFNTASEDEIMDALTEARKSYFKSINMDYLNNPGSDGLNRSDRFNTKMKERFSERRLEEVKLSSARKDMLENVTPSDIKVARHAQQLNPSEFSEFLSRDDFDVLTLRDKETLENYTQESIPMFDKEGYDDRVNKIKDKVMDRVAKAYASEPSKDEIKRINELMGVFNFNYKDIEHKIPTKKISQEDIQLTKEQNQFL